jgi:bifunctional oligoribonuclease and PAP phosphatase NrnA
VTLPAADGLAEFLGRFQRILLTPHENPDADALGAMLALGDHLRALGKEVRLVVTPNVPSFLAFLDPGGAVEPFDGRSAQLADWPEAWVLVDTSDPARIGPMEGAYHASGARKACLDHHLQHEVRAFDAEYVDPEASASAQLVYRLLAPRMPRPLPESTVRALYVGIVDDTGNFRFSNTSPEIHRIAAELIEQGADPARLYQALYHQGRPEKLRVQSLALQGMALQLGGAYARLSLSRSDLRACGASHEDLDGLVNRPLELRGVEVSCLLEELEDGRVKASLRSRERVNVNAVARRFGGGGHFLASGTRLDGPLPRAQTEMDAAVADQAREDLSGI